jgi:Flp pilus assembly protein TadD
MISSDLFRVGQVMLARDKLHEAEATFREVIDLDHSIYLDNSPHRSVVVRYLAAVLERRGKSDDAEIMVRKEIDAHPSNVAYVDVLAYLYVSRDDWTAAADQLLRATELTPDEEGAFFNAAVALLRADQGEPVVLQLGHCRQSCVAASRGRRRFRPSLPIGRLSSRAWRTRIELALGTSD